MRVREGNIKEDGRSEGQGGKCKGKRDGVRVREGNIKERGTE